jgi:protein-tyrosine phosphatase
MDRRHHHRLKSDCPANYANRIRMFMDYAPEISTSDVPDPYYGPGDGFARVFNMIEQASLGLLAKIESHHLKY